MDKPVSESTVRLLSTLAFLAIIAAAVIIIGA